MQHSLTTKRYSTVMRPYVSEHFPGTVKINHTRTVTGSSVKNTKLRTGTRDTAKDQIGNVFSLLLRPIWDRWHVV